ncbi:MAG: phosphosulfolactate synthase [Bacteroidota bacterium]
MNFSLPYLPERPSQPRNHGLTMMMDKGLSLRQTEDFLDASAPYCDIVKLGFGTSMVTPNLKQKIRLYHEAGMRVYLGGTLFEAFIARNMFEDYMRLLDDLNLEVAEVSDGSIELSQDRKCEYIRTLAKDRTVLSEVGSKEEGILISPSKWIKMMQTELQAGSWKVIAEARESGTVGIYRPSGSAHTQLVNKIISKINIDDILWEAPIKKQQVWFIKLLGANVNLGNISHEEVIPLETLRIGLRGDTFFDYLPAKLGDPLRQKVTEKQ